VSYASRLEAHAKSIGRDTKIAIVGAGQMGHGFGCQVDRMPGLTVSLVIDIDPARITALYLDLGEENPVISDDKNDITQALLAGKRVGTTVSSFLSELPIDFVVEATGVPEIGAQITYSCLKAKMDVAVLNVEMDVTIGPLLHKTAVDNGVIYTVCHGDEPIEAKVLVDYARDLNFEVVAAGKGKNNPFEPLSNPDSVRERATAKNMNPKMLCSFTDGSKTMTEMVALANTTGIPLSKRGMYGPAATVKTLNNVFALKEDGGVLDKAGVIDYCTGDVAPGVFVIVRSDSKYINHEMTYLGMGPGPYFTLYRPYHLASVEAPMSVARAVVDRESSLFATSLIAEVVTMSKKDLVAGERIDGIGGFTVRGYADIAADARAENLVPIGLIQNAIMKRDVPVGTLLTYDDVVLDQNSLIVALRKEQDEMGLTYAS
jgi:predicted homoserine dehydrogenase-like protein